MRTLLTTITAIMIFMFIKPSQGDTRRNNVCKTYWDYLFINTSRNCYYNPDFSAQTTEIIHRHIGSCETYEVTTEDGYILTIFRIPRRNPKGVIILQHPVTADSTVWVGQSNQSLGITLNRITANAITSIILNFCIQAFLLWRSGYDIWLPNHRGTFNSRRHVNLKTSDRKYWDFSFHEIGLYDYKAIIDFVRDKTYSQGKIIFVTHSMSTTSALIYSSLRPQEADRAIKIFIEMSPVAYLKQLQSPVRFLAHITPLLMIFNEVFRKTHLEEYDSDLAIRTRNFMLQFPFKYLFTVMISMSQGWNPDEFDPALLNLSISQLPRSYPWKIFYHYVQQYLSGGRFQMYDYGAKLNKNLYGAIIPPEYPVENIITPTYLIYSQEDSLAAPKDVDILYKKLSPEAKKFGRLQVSGVNHVDYHYGRNRKERVYDKILQLLDKI